MKNSNFPTLLMWLMILGIGFFAGSSWTNYEKKPADHVVPAKDLNESLLTNNNSTNPTKNNPTNKQGRKFLSQEQHTIDLFENAAPSVAYITTSNLRRDYFSMNVTEIPSGSGSGFVWDKKGHIVTNYHVIQKAHKASVTLADQSTWEATLVGAAPDKDLAILKIDAPLNKLNPIPLGRSEDLKVGQSVYAIGNPFGLDQSLTTGIISALDREIESVSGIPIRGAIQTDAAINPGNSGGPLLDSSGELIGVNTMIISPSGAFAGIGFSIPVDVVSWVVPDLIKYGKLNRPTLGIEAATTSAASRLGIEGVLIIHVLKGSGASKAGLKSTFRNGNGQIVLGDVIKAINGESIPSRNELLLVLEKYKPGETIDLTIERQGKLDHVKLILDGVNE